MKAVDNYDNFKDFFEAQTNSRDYWKAEELRQFLDKLEAPFEEKEVLQAMKDWSGSDRTSVKYDELYRAFKPILGMTMSLSNFKRTKTEISAEGGESPLQGLMEQLMRKEPDLLAFFRKHDLKENWIVDQKIEKVLRSYVKADEETLKRAFL